VELDNGPFPIGVSHITASSERDYDHGPDKARLHFTPAAWCPSKVETLAPTPNMYIQVIEY